MESDAAVPALTGIAVRLAVDRLAVLGGFTLGEDEAGLPAGTRTVLLIGPGAGFWPHLTDQAEWESADPVDRWSRRVIGRLACEIGAKALFPFGGPPWHPFFTWALRTGRIHQSPVRLLVHDAQGLWVSFRGALALKEALEMPPAPPPPCATCAEKPCLTACPPRALTGAGYDIPACHAYLDTGPACMTTGCLVRGACPVSHLHDRMPGQSAYHMGQFHR